MEKSEFGPEVRAQVDKAVELLEELENFQDSRLSDFEAYHGNCSIIPQDIVEEAKKRTFPNVKGTCAFREVDT